MSAIRTAVIVGAGLLVGVAAGLWAAERGPRAAPAASELPANARTPCDCGPPHAGAAGAPAAAQPAAGPPERSRAVTAAGFAVCPREESPARLAPVALSAGPPLWALHCGQSVHLIALRELAGQLVPERVARLEMPRPGATEASVTTEAAAADLDGDGRADLLVPALFADRAGAPSGGALLHLRQRPEGGLAPPVRLLEAAPAAVVAFALDAQPGQDLALLQRQDAANHRADELWLLQGGRAPMRVARLPAGVAATALAALDLDRDDRADLAVASAADGKLRLFLSRRGPLAQTAPLEVEVAGVRSAVTADLDADGAPDLLLATGDRLVALLARPELDTRPVEIAAAQELRDVSVMDVNADGKPDILGYEHPALILFTQNGGFTFARKPLAVVRGSGAVLRVQVAQLDRDPRPDAAIAAIFGESVEFATVRNLENESAIEIATSGKALTDAVWMERWAAP